jgi:hypothetical protein
MLASDLRAARAVPIEGALYKVIGKQITVWRYSGADGADPDDLGHGHSRSQRPSAVGFALGFRLWPSARQRRRSVGVHRLPELDGREHEQGDGRKSEDEGDTFVQPLFRAPDPIFTTSTRPGSFPGVTFGVRVTERPAGVIVVTSTSTRPSVGSPTCTGITLCEQ